MVGTGIAGTLYRRAGTGYIGSTGYITGCCFNCVPWKSCAACQFCFHRTELIIVKRYSIVYSRRYPVTSGRCTYGISVLPCPGEPGAGGVIKQASQLNMIFRIGIMKGMFFVKRFSPKKASEFPTFIWGIPQFQREASYALPS